MSTAKWKFTLAYSNDMTGDVAEALRASGFGVLESEAIVEALMETTELAVTIKKNSEIDPHLLFQNLQNIGMTVRWWNQPAA